MSVRYSAWPESWPSVATIAVLAGKNDSKLATIERLTAAGIHILADKPWATSIDCLPALQAVTTCEGALAMDIMTNKHDVVARLRQEIVGDPALFGTFRTDAAEPCVEIGSVHQVYTEEEGAILMVLGAGANVTIEPEQWPSGEHPFRSTTVAGTGGWQGTKGGALAPKDDGQ